MNRFEKRLRAINETMLERVEAYKAIYNRADEEDRDPTDDERLEVEGHIKAIEVLKEEKRGVEANLQTLRDVERTGEQLGSHEPIVQPPQVKAGGEPIDRFVKSVGEMFTESAGFKKLQDEYRAGGRLHEGASTGAVPLEAKGTLLEGAGGGGGALAPTVPQVIPGVVDTQFQPLTVSDLLLSGQASTNSLRYVVEGTATSGAAGVAEAGAKPESTLGLTTTDEPVKKIATILPISEEMLEDAPAVQAYINGRLSLFVRIEEERQLLRGGGTNELVGLLAAARSINIYAGGTAAGNKAVQLFKAMNGTRGSSLVEPNFVVLSPADWEGIRLLTDTAGQFFGGGPFFGPYGGPQGPAPTGQSRLTGATDQIWGKPVVITSALGSGTALVGNSSSAQVWRRGGLSVEATNSHSDYFAKNLVAIRAEQREALAVYRPSAFTEVRLA